MRRVINAARLRLTALVAVAVAMLAGALVITAAPPASAGGPSATIAPSTGLNNLQIVTVKGSGFPPDSRIQILECAGTALRPPKDNNACQGLTLNTEAVTDLRGQFVNEPHDPSGKTGGVRIFTLPRKSFSPYPPKCDATDPCGLYVGVQETDFSQPHTFVPFFFAGAPSREGGGSSDVPVAVVAVLAVLAIGGGAVVVARRRSARRSAGG